MPVNVLFSARSERWDQYAGPLTAAFAAAAVEADLQTEFPDPEAVDYIVYAPNSGLEDFRPYTRLKAVLNLWAGVEDVVANPTLAVPLARMVDPGLTGGMVEWVTGHVLRHHLGIDIDLAGQTGIWTPRVTTLARDRRVGFLGLGALGAACAAALVGLNFDVAGWSGSAKALPGVACRSGPEGLKAVLARSEILVLLLPYTAATDRLIDAAALAAMPAGAILLNPGRGGLIDDDALLAALETGHLGHATLDVFREEPLPPGHPFWTHPGVTVTPHIASLTRPASAARAIAENIRRGEAGEPFAHLVDRQRGY